MINDSLNLFQTPIMLARTLQRRFDQVIPKFYIYCKYSWLLNAAKCMFVKLDSVLMNL